MKMATAVHISAVGRNYLTVTPPSTRSHAASGCELRLLRAVRLPSLNCLSPPEMTAPYRCDPWRRLRRLIIPGYVARIRMEWVRID